MKTIFVVMDSLNRHYLSSYGGTAVRTPSIDRLARRGVVFDNHYSGSLPCMPARRELMTGRLNFLEAPWGPIEPWDDCLPNLLRHTKGTYSHLITDHYHYFHSGGEAYHTLFDSYEFERGQEGDRWKPVVDIGPLPSRPRGKPNLRFYKANRTSMDREVDESYSTPRCFQRAIEFLERNHESDNWHLHLEVFDPHEPFDCPSRYTDMYDDHWSREHFTWPDYAPTKENNDDAQTVDHIRKCYAGTLSMADAWLGKMLDAMDRLKMWEDVTLVFTTDHGHLLGEHGYWAKNYMFDYEELAHIPMIVCSPDTGGNRRASMLTATMDLMPTFLDLHGADVPASAHGISLVPGIRGAATDLHAFHDAVMFGYFGKDLNIFDGRYTYCRQPEPGSTVHHHTAVPRSFSDFIDRSLLAGAETGTFLRHCHAIPHYRIAVPSQRHLDASDFNPIYDLERDPHQSQPVHDPILEAQLETKMRRLLEKYDAPDCQFERTGLA